MSPRILKVLFVIFMLSFLKRFSSVFPFSTSKKELFTEINVAPAQLHPNSWAFIWGFIILYTRLGLLSFLEVFLYFFVAKRLGRQLWVSFNGVFWRTLLSLFQQSYKGFKGKFLKIRYNKRDPTLLDGFPLYYTEEPGFQGARCLEDLPQRDQEVCQFLSSLKVVFDTAFLISRESTPGALKVYTSIFHSLLLMGISLLLLLITFYSLSHIGCWLRLTRRILRKGLRGWGRLLKRLRAKRIVWPVSASTSRSMLGRG